MEGSVWYRVFRKRPYPEKCS